MFNPRHAVLMKGSVHRRRGQNYRGAPMAKRYGPFPNFLTRVSAALSMSASTPATWQSCRPPISQGAVPKLDLKTFVGLNLSV